MSGGAARGALRRLTSPARRGRQPSTMTPGGPGAAAQTRPGNRMADDADDWADPDDGRAFPVAVLAGGLMLAAQGGLAVVGGLTAAVLLVRAGNGIAAPLGLPIVLLGAVAAVAGAAAARGRVVEVWTGGVVLTAFGALALLLTASTLDRPHVDAVELLAGVSGAVAIALPGLLALAGGRQYDAWRAHRRGV